MDNASFDRHPFRGLYAGGEPRVGQATEPARYVPDPHAGQPLPLVMTPASFLAPEELPGYREELGAYFATPEHERDAWLDRARVRIEDEWPWRSALREQARQDAERRAAEQSRELSKRLHGDR